MKKSRFKQHLFSLVPRTNIQRSSFDRSFNCKTAINSGYLYPIFVDEVLPGQTINLRPSIFARMATMVVPVMDNVYLDYQVFFVPNRLVWEHWVNFCGEQENPDDSIDYLVPTLDAPNGGFPVGSLADYFGLPTGVPIKDVNALPFRCYNLIWNEWYRDENLQDSLIREKGDFDTINNYKLVRRGKRHDYFTSCLPYPQKFMDDGVQLPLGQTAQLTGSLSTVGGTKNIGYFTDRTFNAQGLVDLDGYTRYFPASTGSGTIGNLNAGSLVNGVGSLAVDLTTATAISINDLRTAFQIQKFLERSNIGGSRYVETIYAHFNVRIPDARLQRPEYLGGGSTRIQISSVPQTSATDSTTPQGNLSAYGFVGTNKGGFTKSFVEHGYIICLVSMRADLNYQQGLRKLWSRQTLYDFYWPTFAHLGEQAVLNKEIVATGDESRDNEVFGYIERYGEYRYMPNFITGQLRSQYSQSLDVWHFAQDFGDSAPALNSDFIEDKPPIRRCLAVTDENYPELILDINFKYLCASPMPTYGTPGLVDHF